MQSSTPSPCQRYAPAVACLVLAMVLLPAAVHGEPATASGVVLRGVPSEQSSADARGDAHLKEPRTPYSTLIFAFTVIAATGPVWLALRRRARRSSTRKLKAEYAHRRSVEAALRASELRYRSLIEDTPILLCSYLADGSITFVNDAFCRYFKSSIEELIGVSFFTFIPDDDSAVVVTELKQLTLDRATHTHEHLVIAPNGRLRWHRWTTRALFDEDGRINAYQSFGDDITERKEAEDEYRKAYTSLREFRDIATLVDVDLAEISDRILASVMRMTESRFGFFGFVDEEEATMEIHTWSGETMSGCSIDGVPPHAPVASAGVWAEAIRGRAPLIVNDYASNHSAKKGVPDGHIPLSRLLVVPVFGHGRIVACAAVADRSRDYTRDDAAEVGAFCENAWAIVERKRAEDALRESNERYRTSFHSSSDAIGVFTSDGHALDANRRMVALSGYLFTEGQSPDLFTLFPGESAEKFTQRRSVLEAGGDLPMYEAELATHDGRTIPVEVSVSAMWDCYDEPVVFQTTIRDVSERKRTEEALRNHQRLESLGVLAGGIAHDFNNLLGAIFGNIDLASQLVGEEAQEVREYLDDAMAAYDRAKDLTRQLLTFSRGGEPQKQTVALAPLLGESMTLSLSGSRVSYRVDVDKKLRTINADVGQLSQVLNNILLNARQAMPDGGTVIVTANNVRLDGSSDSGRGLEPGIYTRIVIEDDGPGIPEQLLPRVFDPFFTTKKTGTGLGLAMCHSIIHKHGGEVSIRSASDHGTMVEILLPASPRSEELKEQTATPAGSLRGRVLVMDDEKSVLDTAVSMLAHLGLESSSAMSGEEAVDAVKKSLEEDRPFDVALLDLTVRGGTGGEVAMARILELDPSVRGIVASGYAEGPVLSDPEAFGFCCSIEKPYRLAELFRTIESALGQ